MTFRQYKERKNRIIRLYFLFCIYSNCILLRAKILFCMKKALTIFFSPFFEKPAIVFFYFIYNGKSSNNDYGIIFILLFESSSRERRRRGYFFAVETVYNKMIFFLLSNIPRNIKISLLEPLYRPNCILYFIVNILIDKTLQVTILIFIWYILITRHLWLVLFFSLQFCLAKSLIN